MLPLRVLHEVRRRILLHRRLIGSACAALAVWLVVQASSAPPPRTVGVWTAADDLPSGTVLDREDLTRAGYTPDSVPAAAIRSIGDVLGRTLATPLGPGEPITRAHVVGSDRLAGYPGRVAVAVRIPDPGVAALLTPGQHVALLAADPQGTSPAERIVADAAVLAVPRARDDTHAGGLSGGLTGRLVVVAVPGEDVEELAAASTTRYLTVVWSR